MGGFGQGGEFAGHGVNLASDGVTGDGPACPALGNQGPNPGSPDSKQGLRSLGPRPCRIQRTTVQREMRGACHSGTRQNGVELLTMLETLHVPATESVSGVRANDDRSKPSAQAPRGRWPSDSQTLAALGAARVDDGAATAGLHADQKAVSAGTAHFGRLVGAFHDLLTKRGVEGREPRANDCARRSRPGNPALSPKTVSPARKGRYGTRSGPNYQMPPRPSTQQSRLVDKF